MDLQKRSWVCGGERNGVFTWTWMQVIFVCRLQFFLSQVLNFHLLGAGLSVVLLQDFSRIYLPHHKPVIEDIKQSRLKRNIQLRYQFLVMKKQNHWTFKSKKLNPVAKSNYVQSSQEQRQTQPWDFLANLENIQHTNTCASQRVGNHCFSENLTCFVFLKHPFWD